MADAAPTVNGVYQYAQPAELAASTPSAPSHAPSASQSTSNSNATPKAEAQEIGWYFVEQYYTTLSRSPDRIHLFYNKKSQLITGVEAEKVIPTVGSKAISDKIKSLDIQDCKVRVLNVDSQSSFSNIVVQVIGEMSNKDQPHHKFVQTFVLAEQPNGYFVLNDIFRYLNNDEDEIVEDAPQPAEVPAEEPPTPTEGVADSTPTEETVTTEEAAEKVDEELEEAQENTDATAEVPDAQDAPAITEEVPATSPSAEADLEESEDAPAPESSAQEDPVDSDAADEPPQQPKAPTPAPEAAPAKKTWASMVGGKAPTTPAVPSQTVPPAQSKSPRPVQQSQSSKQIPTEPAAATSPNQSNGWQMAESGKKGKTGPPKPADGNTLAYIKNVNEKVDARLLREVLERHGELKYYDVARIRNAAFVEFATPQGYAAAVAANPHTVGTETISVEERRPRPGAYGGSQANFGRGNGTPGRGGGRGNMQQRTGSSGGLPKDASRGGFQQQQQQQPRGAKSGNVTPKGRGQGAPVA